MGNKTQKYLHLTHKFDMSNQPIGSHDLNITHHSFSMTHTQGQTMVHEKRLYFLIFLVL